MEIETLVYMATLFPFQSLEFFAQWILATPLATLHSAQCDGAVANAVFEKWFDR